jgi:hypothetical protein
MELVAAALKNGDADLAREAAATGRLLFPRSRPLGRIAAFLNETLEASQDHVRTPRPKVFGIGLSRTGTGSLHEALVLLGFRALHWRTLEGAILGLPEILRYEALTDISMAFQFESLHYMFPEARFIYTERDLERWEVSIRHHYRWARGFDRFQRICRGEEPMEGIVGSAYWRAIHLGLYANHADWRTAYAAHESRVGTFFSGTRAASLLRIEITSEALTDRQKWEALADFVGTPREAIPLAPFPSKNVRFPTGQRSEFSVPAACRVACDPQQLLREAQRTTGRIRGRVQAVPSATMPGNL